MNPQTETADTTTDMGAARRALDWFAYPDGAVGWLGRIALVFVLGFVIGVAVVGAPTAAGEIGYVTGVGTRLSLVLVGGAIVAGRLLD